MHVLVWFTFLYIYIACDVLYYYFISYVANPSWSFSLRALYSVSEPYQPLASTLSLRASPLHASLVIIMFYMYARVVLTSRAGTYSAFVPAHFPSYPIGISLVPFGFRGS